MPRSGGEAFEVDFGGNKTTGFRRPPNRFASPGSATSKGSTLRARPTAPSGGSRFARPIGASRKVFEAGQRVKVKNKAGIAGYSDGIIYKKYPDNTYDIEFDNGKFEGKVAANRIAVPPPSDNLSDQESKGGSDTEQKVSSRTGGLARSPRKRIEDEEKQEGKAAERKEEAAFEKGESTRFGKDADVMEKGAKVEANYRGRGRWFPGVIARDRGDGTYDVDYDDGEAETRVKEDMIRLIGGDRRRDEVLNRAGSRARDTPMDGLYQEDDTVEVNFQGRGRWLPGVITRRKLDGTYDVRYDNGDLERGVEAQDLRAASGRKGKPSSASDRQELVSKRTREKIQAVCRKFQSTSAESTCYKQFEQFEEANPTGIITKKELKAGLRSIYQQTKSRDDDNFQDWIDDDELNNLIDALSFRQGASYTAFLAFALDEKEDSELEKLHERLQKQVVIKSRLKAKDIIKQFSSSRTFKSGYVRVAEFEKVAKKLSSELNSSNIELISKRWDIGSEGTVDHCMFVLWLFTGTNGTELPDKLKCQLALLDEKTVETALNRNSSRGNIGVADLQMVVEDLGLVFSHLETVYLFKQLDTQNEAEIPVEQLLNLAYRGKGSGRVLGSIDLDSTLIPVPLREELRDLTLKHLDSSRKSLGQLLLENSENKTGSVNRSQFRKILEMMEVQLRESDETLIFESLDYSGGFLLYEDLLVFLLDVAWENDNVEAAKIIKDTLGKKKVSAKEFFRTLSRQDSRGKGYIDHAVFEKVMKKCCGSAATSDHIFDLKRFLDPHKLGSVDSPYAASMAAVSLDAGRAEKKLKNCLRLMRVKKINYREAITDALEGGKKLSDKDDDRGSKRRGKVTENLSAAELVDVFNSFGMPMLKSELELVAEKHQRHGEVRVLILLDQLEDEETLASTKQQQKQGYDPKNSNTFGRDLWRKICKLRANDSIRSKFRSAVLEKDPDLLGRLGERDLQRVLDQSLDLTDEELALLLENLHFTDSSNTHDFDYPYLLLLLAEPIANPPVTAGSAMMAKMMRGSTDIIGLRRLLSLLFRSCAAHDNRALGLIVKEDASKVFKEECHNLDPKFLTTLLRAFQDLDSDCILYPELIAFLGCCYLDSNLYRLNYFNLIRQRQGYKLKEFFVKLKVKLDQHKFSEHLVGLGMLFSEVSLQIIFSKFGTGKQNSLDVEALFRAMANGVGVEEVAGKRERQDITPYQAEDGSDPITEKILSEYDQKVVKCLQIAFDMFDQKNNNEIQATELERVMCSLGQHELSLSELEDLMGRIDKRNNGMLHYDDFIKECTEFLRARYRQAGYASVAKMYELFRKYDRSGDGLLQPNELKQILLQASSAVSEEELNAVIEFLDCDEDGDISWEEFREALEIIHDDAAMERLTVEARTALRYIQFSSLPDPEEYITTFVGLPSNYRMSILSGVEKSSVTHSLQHIVCKNTPLGEMHKRNNEMQLQVQVVRVTGIASEDPLRTEDIVCRGVKFSICQTSKPPTLEEPGNPPDFLGNVTLLHANVHPKFQDVWQFANKDELDPDKSCFVRCMTDHLYDDRMEKTDDKTVEVKKSPNEELYLFIELILTMRLSNAFRITPYGIRRVKKKKKKEKKKKVEKPPEEEDKGRDTQGGIKAGTTETEISKMRFFRRKKKKKVKKPKEEEEDDDDDDFWDEDEEGFLLENGEDGEEKDFEAGAKIVDVCAGWAMIPIASTMRTKKGKFKVQMCGGTPFAQVGIKNAEVRRRPGVWQAIRRMFGKKINSKLEIIITPTNRPTNLKPPAPKSAPAPKTEEGEEEERKVVIVEEEVEFTHEKYENLTWLIHLLPTNITVPTSSVTVLGIYRKLLQQSLHLRQDMTNRALPQSGSLHHADALLSSFPRLLADPAACNVLLMLWKKQFPKELNGKTFENMTVADASHVRALQSFRNVVLQLWRAFSSPTAQPSKLYPFETAEDILRRECYLRNSVGLSIPPHGKPVPKTTTSTTTNSKPSGGTTTGGKDIPTGTAQSLELSSTQRSTSATTLAARPPTGQQLRKSHTIVGGIVVSDADMSTAPTPLVGAGGPSQIMTDNDQLVTPFHSRELLWAGNVVNL